ncbi:MAG: energy transducer TonB [Steroidobacterales bacterium]
MMPQSQDSARPAEDKVVRHRRTEVLIVSGDDDFLIELGPVLGDRYRTRTLDSVEAIASSSAGSRWLAIVDTASLPDARNVVARIGQEYPHAPLIIVTPSLHERSAAGARGSIIATIARNQLSSPRLIDALSAAEAQLSSNDSALPAAPNLQTQRTATQNNGIPMAIRIAASLIVAAIATWLAVRYTTSAPPAAASLANTNPATAAAPGAAAAAAAAPANPLSVQEMLSAARGAFRDQKLLLPRPDVEPRGDSALELYTQALAQEPTNDEALDGVRRLLAVGKSRIQSDIAGNKLDDATRVLGFFKSAAVDADSLRDLDAGIASARPRWLAARAQESIAAGEFAAAEQLIAQVTAAGGDRSVIADLRRAIDNKRLEQQLSGMANEVKAAIESGALLDPAADNARTRLQAMRNFSRSHPLTLAAQHELQAALLIRAQDATRKDQFDLAQRYISAAGDISPSADVTEAKQKLQNGIDQAAQRAAAAADAKAKEGAAASAASAASSARSSTANEAKSNATNTISAHPTTPLAVKFPSAAADAKIQGYVLVEFTLHPDGSASDATVIEAKPASVFDRAATDAVTRAHYDTSALQDKQPQRARLRLTFKLS